MSGWNSGVRKAAMADLKSRKNLIMLLLAALLLIAAGIWCCIESRSGLPRSEALEFALRSVMEKQGTDQALVARTILESFQETRDNASRWSGIYWGFTFCAAAFSALAGLILKLESFLKSEAAKKDIAAVLSVAAAVMITVSTSGDFQRKWQANRIAAAEIERAGYDFLENDGANPRSYMAVVGKALLQKNLAIVGGSEQRKASGDVAKASAGK